MNGRALLDRLHAHQDGVLAIMRGAELLLRDPASRDVAGLARARWALMRALTAYGLFKLNEIFDPAISRRVLGEAQRAERMKRACVAMGDEFRGHVAKWSGADVAGEWASYQPAALAMMARLRAHIATEKREVAALVERMGVKRADAEGAKGASICDYSTVPSGTNLGRSACD